MPVQADWSLVTFSMKRDDGSEIEVEMIRPTYFWQQQGAVPGAHVFMEFPELEVSTHALVRKVEPCPAIADGAGNVVTARIITLTATDLVELTLASGETILGTPPHPIWPIATQDWIELGDIEPGDEVWMAAGPVEVLSTDLRSTAETVYNIEVHGHHIYQIGDAGVLVHNAGGISRYKNQFRNSNTGKFGQKIGRPKVISSTHNNSLSSTAKTFCYSLRSTITDRIRKFGDTINKDGRYSKVWLRKHQLKVVIEAAGSKRAMHQLQHNKIMNFKMLNGGKRPDLNRSDW